MGGLIDQVAALSSSWSDFYGGSSGAETLVVFLHLGGMAAAGGVAFTFDRAVLLSGRSGWPRRDALARDLHLSHRAVVVGLGVVLLSGLALTAADPAVFLTSWIYWTKIVIVVLLLANGWMLKRSGDRLLAEPEDATTYGRLRAAAVRSGALWAFSILAGVALTVYA